MSTPSKFIDSAKKYDKVPYLYGGKTKTALDCSGLITLALKDIGIDFPHGSEAQIAATESISIEEALRTPGALLHWPGHIAISLGNNTTFEALNPEHGTGLQRFADQRPWKNAGLISALTTTPTNPTVPNPAPTPTTGNKMISPVQGTVSSEYGYRTLNGQRQLHAGIDVATSGRTGAQAPVYAAFAGTVSNVVSNRVHDLSTNQVRNQGKAHVAPGRSGNGLRVKNPDGETQVYIHVKPVVSNNQTVARGQLLGHIDLSGFTTGAHLHFETWRSNGNLQNPRVYFNFHNIAPGSAPKLPPVASQPSTRQNIKAWYTVDVPAGSFLYGRTGPSTSAKTKTKRQRGFNVYVSHTVVANGRTWAVTNYDTYYAFEFLKRGKNALSAPTTPTTPTTPRQDPSILAYQKRQNRYGKANLTEDGIRGPQTIAWENWVKDLQRNLRPWVGVPSNLPIDGDYGPSTYEAVRTVQRRNGLTQDGFAQTQTINFMRSKGSQVKHRP